MDSRQRSDRPVHVRPKFNVSEPFEGIIAVQMNQCFRDTLCRFITECEGVDAEILVFYDVMTGRNEFNEVQGFSVSPPYGGVTIVQMDETFANIMKQFISDIEGVESEIWAFRQALADPAASSQLRAMKKMQRKDRDNGGSSRSYGGGRRDFRDRPPVRDHIR